MKKEDLTLFVMLATLASSLVLLYEFFMKHRNGGFSMPGNGAGVVDFSTGPTNISIGDRGRSGLAACGCGGSYGDFTVPTLNPIFGETQPKVPYAPPVVLPPELGVSFIGNGSGV